MPPIFYNSHLPMVKPYCYPGLQWKDPRTLDNPSFLERNYVSDSSSEL